MKKNMMIELQSKYGIALKDYSQSFCKIEFSSTTNAISSSDKTCLELEPIK